MFWIRLATVFGIGRLPKAPGTWGSLVALPLCVLLNYWGPFYSMVGSLLVVVLAIIAADRYERQSSQHDSKEIVIDEVAGMLITTIWLPLTWQSFLVGFVVFRILDVFKPFPISFFDKKVPGGFGVVVDDVVAGLIGSIFMQLLLHHTDWLGVQIQNIS